MYINAIIKCTHKGGGSMPPYKRMYFHLFNAITDALQKLTQQEYAQAKEIMKAAQQWGEEMYSKAGETKDR